MEQKRTVALIPAYRPGEALLELLAQGKEQGLDLIVVDDGSGGDFAGLFQRAGEYALVLAHPENRGKGRALKTGMAEIQRRWGEAVTVVTLDADGQHRIADALRVLREAREHPGALVLGSRGLREDHVPLRSRLGNGITRLVYRLSTGVRVWDTQTGLRAFGGELLPALLAIPGERYEYEMNVLLEFARRGIPIREVGIETIYLDGNSSSHFDTLRDSCRIYKEIFRFSASSLLSFCTDYGAYVLFLRLARGWGLPYALPLSNVAARVVSAGVNYTVNRRLVFRSRAGVVRSAGQYALLAAAILLGNTLVLELLAEGLGVNPYWAKLWAELLFFFVSWFVQRRFIFGPRREAGEG